MQVILSLFSVNDTHTQPAQSQIGDSRMGDHLQLRTQLFFREKGGVVSVKTVTQSRRTTIKKRGEGKGGRGEGRGKGGGRGGGREGRGEGGGKKG